MIKVALIGAGNLGSRHLQALKLVKRNISISVFEPFEKSMDVAKQRYDEYPSNEFIESIKFISDYKKMDSVYDLVIIATSSRERFEIASWIVQNVQVKYMILEKVVFQKVADFDTFGKMIKEKNIKVWVNCPRRMFDCYKELKDKLKGSSYIKIITQGVDWGLACNTIHQLDLLNYICPSIFYKYDISGLENGIYEGKRKGYKELFGRVIFKSDKGEIELICSKNEEYENKTTIHCNEYEIVIFESKGYLCINGKQENIKFLYQSQLTNILVEQLVDNGTCDLTMYEESACLHKVMLTAFLDQISRIEGREVRICPIT